MMKPASQSGFPLRHNPKGTVDSICPHCYMTVSTRNIEGDLAALEANHICDQSDLFARSYPDRQEGS